MRRIAERFCARIIASLSPNAVLEGFGPRLNRDPQMLEMLRSLPVGPVGFEHLAVGPVGFEHLAGLFASTSLNHGIIAMTIRQAAYIWSLIRETRPPCVLEIGRYRGGGTLLMAAAMEGRGELWSIDDGSKEARLDPDAVPYAEQLCAVLYGWGLRNVRLVTANSREYSRPVRPDLVVIDGDHSYRGVRADWERFGQHARDVLFDDARDEHLFRAHADTVGRCVDEILTDGEYRLVATVDRMVHLRRW